MAWQTPLAACRWRQPEGPERRRPILSRKSYCSNIFSKKLLFISVLFIFGYFSSGHHILKIISVEFVHELNRHEKNLENHSLKTVKHLQAPWFFFRSVCWKQCHIQRFVAGCVSEERQMLSRTNTSGGKRLLVHFGNFQILQSDDSFLEGQRRVKRFPMGSFFKTIGSEDIYLKQLFVLFSEPMGLGAYFERLGFANSGAPLDPL